MKNATNIIKEIQPVFKKAFIEIKSRGVTAEIAEAAIPAYAHKNPIISRIFWGRLVKALNLLPPDATTLLDFGCGTGVASYAAAQLGKSVTAIDLDLRPLRKVMDHITFPKGIDFRECSVEGINGEVGTYDAIIALDVFEHITDLPTTLSVLKSKLAPNGVLIASLPTESFFYRLGRRLAGRHFTGSYHVSNAPAVEAQIGSVMSIDTCINTPPLITLFRIIRARLK